MLEIRDNRHELYIDYTNALMNLGDVLKAIKVVKLGISKSTDKDLLRRKLLEMMELFGNSEVKEAYPDEEAPDLGKDEPRDQHEGNKSPIMSFHQDNLKRERNYQLDPVS